MWWVCGGNLVPQSHPRPLVCGLTTLNRMTNADGDPAEMDFFLTVRSLQKWRVEEQMLDDTFKGVDLESESQ